ncbi:hypothetical protein cyc_05051 [Cyclospora cayetanensis]|uniref:Uncharacterized protein n=1 Tax=Cyclospora cayetanensis TaxID=88456 RepID=A0A1D3D337_9EIME|nr:hypothetical protein cyc_05051 [Cyclospora cayetanensis]
MWGALRLSQVLQAISYRQRVPYGVKQTEAYKKAKQQARAAARNARKMKESKGILLEGRKSLMMSLQQNTGISWDGSEPSYGAFGEGPWGPVGGSSLAFQEGA